MPPIRLEINGKKETLEEETTVGKLLETKNVNPNTVACELNMKIIRRNELGAAVLKEGDVLEIIRMIGGG